MHYQTDEELICDKCGKYFRSHEFKEHIRNMHDPERSTKVNAKNVISSVSKILEENNNDTKQFTTQKIYSCDKCERVFSRQDHLKLHMLRHSDRKDFLCSNCGKMFKRHDKLKEHVKRIHIPEKEAKIRKAKPKFVPKVAPTDYEKFIYKCHACLLGFKRRGMLINHLSTKHPNIPIDSVPELTLPISKTTKDYYCQYCNKIYKSSTKRKRHILKVHPGHELPMSSRKKDNIQEVPGFPDPTYSKTVGSITIQPHHCKWCPRQYAIKSKLLEHYRKNHKTVLTSYTPIVIKVEPACDETNN